MQQGGWPSGPPKKSKSRSLVLTGILGILMGIVGYFYCFHTWLISTCSGLGVGVGFW